MRTKKEEATVERIVGDDGEANDDDDDDDKDYEEDRVKLQ